MESVYAKEPSELSLLEKLLLDFSAKKEFPLRVKHSLRLSKREFNHEGKYWKKFYRGFTDYLYTDLGCFDNYVGSNIKMLRTLFNYLGNEVGLHVGNFHRNFYAQKE